MNVCLIDVERPVFLPDRLSHVRSIRTDFIQRGQRDFEGRLKVTSPDLKLNRAFRLRHTQSITASVSKADVMWLLLTLNKNLQV